MKKGDARKQCQVELKFHSQVNRVIYNPLKKKKKKNHSGKPAQKIKMQSIIMCCEVWMFELERVDLDRQRRHIDTRCKCNQVKNNNS